MVAIAWKYLVHSSPYWILFTVCLCFQYMFLNLSNCISLALTNFLNFHSGRKRAPHSSKESRKKMPLLQISISLRNREKFLLHDLSAFLSSLNFTEIFAAAFVLRILGEDQLFLYYIKKPRMIRQEILKSEDFSLWYIGARHNITRNVIRDGLCHR